MIKQNNVQSRTILLAISLCLLGFALPTYAKETISWKKNYQEAVSTAKQTGKPILVLFTGSDWCSWCKKLEKEVFDTEEFSKVAGDSFVFVSLDFPMKSNQSPEEKKQNERLKKQYGVRGFPTVVILDPQEEKITSTGYLSGGGRKYGEHLLKVLSDYDSYRKNQQQAATSNPCVEELENLYHQAKELGRVGDINQIIAMGKGSKNPLFFA